MSDGSNRRKCIERFACPMRDARRRHAHGQPMQRRQTRVRLPAERRTSLA
ncbi:conserved hypothetical protein [Burkholderia mallei ATCC 10399]|nr:conserved hypothetical protein [Burkholderia mallei ATCC 10399]